MIKSFIQFINESSDYEHVKDTEVERPRLTPTPKTDGMMASRGSSYFDLYLQDQASDVMVDKVGYERGVKNWEYTLGQGGAMFASAAKIANEKYTMLKDLGQLDSYGNDYFKRSYYDIWKEWKDFKSGKKPVTISKPVSSKPTVKKEPKRSGSYSEKDTMRIHGIIHRANGNVSKETALAQQMANSIDNPEKAMARGYAAESENYHNLAEIFFKRGEELTK